MVEPSSIDELSTEDICHWLKGLNLHKYCDKFRELGVDGSILFDIQDDDLIKDFQVGIRIHRVKIIENIKKLKLKQTSPKKNITESDMETPVLQDGLQRENPPLEIVEEEKKIDLNPFPLLEMEGEKIDIPELTSLQEVVPVDENIESENPYTRDLEERFHRDLPINKNTGAGEHVLELAPSHIPRIDQKGEILVLKAVEGQLLNNIFIVGDSGATLGRHSASNDIVISESFVSRKHCEIIHKNSVFYLQDIGSTTGTFIMIRNKVPLKKNMKFQMGLSEFEVEELEDNIENPRCMMDIFEGPARKNKVELNEKGIEIGRDSNNSLAVCEDSQMSNFHAKIMYENNKFMLKDEGSTNKTWLRLSGESSRSDPFPIRLGDIIKVGSTVFVVQNNNINMKNLPIVGAKHGSHHIQNTKICKPRGEGESEESRGRRQKHNEGIEESKSILREVEKVTPGEGGVRRSFGEEKYSCKICFTQESDAAFLPCGHNCCCIECAHKCNQCPICRLHIIEVIKIYKG